MNQNNSSHTPSSRNKSVKIPLKKSIVPFAFFVGFTLLWIYFIKPQVLNWAKTQIEQINQRQNYVTLQNFELDLSLAKLQINLRDLRLFLNKYPENKLSVSQVKFQIDPFDIIIGQFQISNITLENAEIKLDDDLLKLTSDEPTDGFDLEPLFKVLPQVPLSRISFLDANLEFKIKNKETLIQTQIDQFSIKLDQDKISNVIEAQFKLTTLLNPTTTVKASNKFNAEEPELQKNSPTAKSQWLESEAVQIYALFDIYKNKIQLSQINAKTSQSKVNIRGELQNLISFKKNPLLNLATDSKLSLSDTRDWIFYFNTLSSQKATRIPQLSGLAHLKGTWALTQNHSSKGTFNLNTQNIQIDYFKIGDMSLNTQLNDNQISIDNLEAQHPAGLIELSDFKIQLKTPYIIQSKYKVHNFDAQKLFRSLGNLNIPVKFQASSQGQCVGQIKNLLVSCKTSSKIQNIQIHSELKQPPLVELKEVQLTGDLGLKSDSIGFVSTAFIENSKADISGMINFNNGFRIQTTSEKLILNDIKNILGLNLKGQLSGHIETQGNSQSATFNGDIAAQNFEISKFKIGKFQTFLKYQKGELSFNELSGSINKTKLSGELSLNFNEMTTEGDFISPELYGQDVISVFKDKFGLNFDISGQGQGQMNFSGPLDFWKLKMNLTADLKNGFVAGESFDRSQIKITSLGKALKFDQVQIQKNKALIKVTGAILTETSTPQFDLNVESENLRIEYIDTVNNLVPQLSGPLQLKLNVRDSLNNITVKGQFVNRESFIENQSHPSSQGEFLMTPQGLDFDGQIWGRQIQTSFFIPFNTQNNFNLKTQIRQLNTLDLLPLLKINSPPSDEYASQMTANFEFNAPNNNFNQLNGVAKIDQFYLRRGLQSLKLQKPSIITLKPHFQINDTIELKDEDQSIKIEQQNNGLKVSLNFSLKMLQFLTPFLESLNGQVQSDLIIKFYKSSTLSNSFSWSGQGTLKQGLVQAKGFTYPIKDIETSFSFSKNRILINSGTAQINQFPLSTSGYISLENLPDVEMNIMAEMPHIDLEFPKQVQTNGFLKLKISGQRVPYTLKLDYTIENGLITKDFTKDEEGAAKAVSLSPYLPSRELEQKSPSLLFDLGINFYRGLIIKNPLLEGTAYGELKITGSPEIPKIDGSIQIDQTSKLIFKDKPFEIQTGLITFDSTKVAPGDNTPEVLINANSRVSEYDINLLITLQNKVLSIKPTSQPPLNQNDIFSLLTLGFTTATQDQSLSSETQQKQTGLEVLSVITNQSALNKKLQDKLGLNVQLSSSVDSTKNIAVPKVVVSRKLSQKINASYSRPLQGNDQSNEVKLQWLFHPQFSLNLNYQNEQSTQESSIIENKNNDQGQYGIDLEYKKEFK